MTDSRNSRQAKLRQSLQKRGDKLPKDIRRLASAVFDESDDRLSHEDCLATLPAYVDAETEGERVAIKFPAVKQHLDTCADCAAHYAELLEISLADQAGRIPAAMIPAVNLAFLQPAMTLTDFVKQKAAQIVAAVAPAQERDLETIANVFFERINALSGKFILQPNSAQALGLGASGVNEALAILAVTYATTQALVDAFTPEQIESLATKNQLRTQIEAKARTAAETIHVQPKLAKQIAAQYAQHVGADSAVLRALIQQQKR